MSTRRGDIAPLFKHFGGEQAQFKEISCDEDAHLAGERWPLLRNVPLRARDTLPALSAEQKQDRLGKRGSTEEIDIAPPAESVRTGFASALSRLGGLRHSEVERSSIATRPSDVAVKAEPTRVAPQAHRQTQAHASEPLHPTRSEQPTTGFLSRKPAPEADVRQTHEAEKGAVSRLFSKKVGADTAPPRNEPERSGGLFSRKAEAPPPATEAKPSQLGQLFSRLEGGHKEPNREPEPKKSTGLFGRRKLR